MQLVDNTILARCLQQTEGTASQLSPQPHRAFSFATVGGTRHCDCVAGAPAHIELSTVAFQFRPVPALAFSEQSLSVERLNSLRGESRESALPAGQTNYLTLAAGRIHFYPTRAVILEHQSGAKRIQRNGYIPLQNTATNAESIAIT